MKKYEYNIILIKSTSNNNIIEELNLLGNDGWELVSIDNELCGMKIINQEIIYIYKLYLKRVIEN